MGNTEKLAVLIVLLLSAVVLAVSLNDASEEGTVEDPFGAGEVAAAGPGTGFQAGSSRPEGREAALDSAPGSATQQGLPLLDAGLVPNDVASRSRPASGATGLLTTRRGLRPSFVDEYMEYTVERGDTWSGLALRFYSDARMVSSLRIANDDLSELRVGSEILVPVHDLSVEASTRDRYEPAPQAAEAAQAAEVVERGRESRRPQAQRTSGARPTRYTVVDGDNLSKISKKVFGTTTRWAEIYAANRATLKSPDWLSVGMELVIPADGEFAGAQPPAAASTPQPERKQVSKVH